MLLSINTSSNGRMVKINCANEQQISSLMSVITDPYTNMYNEMKQNEIAMSDTYEWP